MRGDESFGLGAQCLGAGDQIGLMRFEEAEHCGEHRSLAGAMPQIVGRKPGQVEQALRTLRIAQRPAERLQSKRLRVLVEFWRAQSITRFSKGTRPVTKRILVVEDNELNLKLFCDLLRAHEYATEGVRDGREAVERARAFAPDLIVTDIQLPHITGLEIIEALKADPELAPIPVMAVTAYAGRDDEERIRAAGAAAYVSKPISVLRFVDAVSALL
jgi:two-component system, cell cycle response regulator DivK